MTLGEGALHISKHVLEITNNSEFTMKWLVIDVSVKK